MAFILSTSQAWERVDGEGAWAQGYRLAKETATPTASPGEEGGCALLPGSGEKAKG